MMIDVFVLVCFYVLLLLVVLFTYCLFVLLELFIGRDKIKYEIGNL